MVREKLYGPPPRAYSGVTALQAKLGPRCGVLLSDCECHPIHGSVFTVWRCKRCGDEEWL